MECGGHSTSYFPLSFLVPPLRISLCKLLVPLKIEKNAKKYVCVMTPKAAKSCEGAYQQWSAGFSRPNAPPTFKPLASSIGKLSIGGSSMEFLSC